jgi:uncharacterized protein
MTMPKQRDCGAPRVLCAASAILTAALLAGCGSSPPDHFYTLAGVQGAAAGAPRALPTSSPFYIEVLPVNVPEDVSRDQMVITTGPGRMNLLEHQRWIAPLSDEIGRALSDNLSDTLGAIDVYRSPRSDMQSVYRVSVNLQRFESVPGTRASVGATWSVRQLPSGTLVTCHSEITEPVGPGYDALVAGHRQALGRLSADIATAVTNLRQRSVVTAGAGVGMSHAHAGVRPVAAPGDTSDAINSAAICPASS